MEEIRQIIGDVLERFTVLTELDPKNWGDRDIIDTLNLAYELDSTGLSTFMLARGLYDRFLRDTTFTAKEILDDARAFTARIDAMRALYELVERPSVVDFIRDFQEKVLAAAAAYAMPAAGIAGLQLYLRDKYQVAEIRLAVFRSMRDLEAHQFVMGRPSGEPLRVNHHIFELWNMNSLLVAMRDQVVDGISLCLIRDPQTVMASYFVFAIRNGENLTILTDRDQGAHPLYWRMSRRPDRAAEKRWMKHWFPYELLDLEAIRDADGFVKGFTAAKRTALVPYHTEAVKLAEIGSLGPPEFMWLSLIFDRIASVYGQQPRMLPALSYTGEMVVRPEALIGQTGAIARRGDYTPLAVVPLETADVTRESTAAQWERVPTTSHCWMEEHYAAQVPAPVLNPVGAEQPLLLEQQHGLRKAGDCAEGGVLETLSPVTFGTREQIERDRQWVARYNQMIYIQHLAEQDFDREHGQVVAWWQAQVERRRDFLIEAGARGEFYSTYMAQGSGWDPALTPEKKNIVALLGGSGLLRAGCVLGQQWDSWHGWGCAVNGSRRACYAYFTCNNALAIADLLGLDISELPYYLQHYQCRHQRPYPGNPILDRLESARLEARKPLGPPRLRCGCGLQQERHPRGTQAAGPGAHALRRRPNQAVTVRRADNGSPAGRRPYRRTR